MSHYFVKAKTFLLEDGERSDQYLEVINGVFGDFYDQPVEGLPVYDWSEFYVGPGLFDTHIHGIKGYEVMDGTPEAINEISKVLLSLGVTRFLPTTLTSSKQDLVKAIKAVKEAVENGLSGAQSEGIFLEGPYFTEKHKGAQNPSYFCDPSVEEFAEWQELSGHSIVKIALAPERDGAMDFIKKVSAEGVLVSIAHTDADYDTCIQAVDAGSRNYVHLFNGMSGLHHRNPGAVGAALTDSRPYAELICDGFHVHPAAATLASQIKGEKLMLITDCMNAGLMPDGEYRLGEFPVIVKDGMAKTETGSLAGSTLKLINGVKNLHQWSDKPLYEIWHKGSLSPAMSLGKGDKLGSIAKGKNADFVVMNQDLEIIATAVDGELKYQK
ncbi:MAG: N-acetylglucosamine-6-phosphate deacetylase [Tuberibacillus sp.]